MIQELHSALATHLVNRLRDHTTEASAFRRIIGQLTLLLADTALENGDLRSVQLQTWQGEETYDMLAEETLVFVTVLRAGLPMLEAAMEYFPKASAGFLATKRDETTHEAKRYYDRVPVCQDKHVVIVDPMVATGGSLVDAVTLIKEKSPAKITSLNIIAAPEGLENVMRHHPDLSLYVARIDKGLNEKKFILPGLGDAGDRAYNTF